MLRALIYSLVPPLSTENCNICFGPTIERVFSLTNQSIPPSPIKYQTLEFFLCTRCGYSFAPGNFIDYSLKKTGTSKPGSSPRIGDGITPGREYYMASDAVEMLGKKKVSVGIFGAGLNRDHELLRILPQVSECALIDLKNFQDSEYFLPISTPKKFDILIVCEVAEHFMNPRKEFYSCLRLLKRGGLIVVSTNLKIQNDFSNYNYPFLHGHTSYYTGRSLIFLASIYKLFIDFRVPIIALGTHSTKRYIYLTSSLSVQHKILEYFSRVQSPRSEAPMGASGN
jgi:SAM-dependent methyltransferase